MEIAKQLEKEFSLKPWQVKNTLELIDDGNTIPFIARYRKEATGSLDDQLLRELSERLSYLRNLEEQKEKVINSITEQELMTDEIMNNISAAQTMTELEDIYRPFRPKRKTRASVAKEKGLQGLADEILLQKPESDPIKLAEKYVSNEVETVSDALQGARDIIAEMISDDPKGRKLLRYSLKRNGILSVKGAQDDLGVYEMYKEYSEPVSKIARHRTLAINRGEKEGFLKVSVEYDKTSATELLCGLHLKNNSRSAQQIKEAIDDYFED